AAVLLLMTGPAWAQFNQGNSGGATLGEARTTRWKVGVEVRAVGEPCRGLVGSIPVPIDWPEQKVRVAEEDVSPNVTVGYEMVDGTVKQMLVRIPFLPANEEARAVITFEIERSTLLPPSDTSKFRIPDNRELNNQLRVYLGPSPLIESRDTRIRALAKEIGADAATAWERVEAIYDWVRENVEYKEGPIKGALAALRDGTGDCEEMASLFIAICRAGGIPARSVWVPGHTYPEFYLVDDQGQGHWFPCQAAGSREFGGITELRPVLQKGDNFRPSHNRRERQRYLAEHLTGVGGKPKARFIRELVDN
ncbi:MAG: transglutaminase family protein, partial [Patescibacteria group bacterium]|nr:transglutaminase family protein [Patescibacteria group bacterium]